MKKELRHRGRSLSSDEESDCNDDARIRCQFVQSAAEAKHARLHAQQTGASAVVNANDIQAFEKN